jgi:restriction system protein
VDVSAVRDLYGTVMNEGANRGILVTTSSYGRDSFEFVKDKPLTLLSGSELLHLLNKHGYAAKIDMSEARRIAKEGFSTARETQAPGVESEIDD